MMKSLAALCASALLLLALQPAAAETQEPAAKTEKAAAAKAKAEAKAKKDGF